MHCIAGQPLVSVLFVAVLIALFLLKLFHYLLRNISNEAAILKSSHPY